MPHHVRRSVDSLYKQARRVQAAVRLTDLQRTLAVLCEIDQPTRGRPPTFELRADGLDTEYSSSADVFGCFRGRLRLDRLAIGGHSFGGCAALTLAAAHLQAGAVERPPIGLAACFTLDPAVEWVPKRTGTPSASWGSMRGPRRRWRRWSASGCRASWSSRSSGSTSVGIRCARARRAAGAAAHRDRTLYAPRHANVAAPTPQEWAYRVCVAPSTGGTSHVMAVHATGHQGLCDVAPCCRTPSTSTCSRTAWLPSAQMAQVRLRGVARARRDRAPRLPYLHVWCTLEHHAPAVLVSRGRTPTVTALPLDLALSTPRCSASSRTRACSAPTAAST